MYENTINMYQNRVEELTIKNEQKINIITQLLSNNEDDKLK